MRTALLTLTTCLLVLPAHAKYGGGTGAPDNPYLIYTAEQMNAIGANPSDWGRHFKLMADVDLSAFDGKEGRPAFKVIAPVSGGMGAYLWSIPFTGVFDGNGHTISHLTIAGENYRALFGYLGRWDAPACEVKNLGLVDVNTASSGWYVGALAGYSFALVTHCYSTGVVRGGGYAVGGLVGYNRSKVIQCCNKAEVRGTGSSVGGVVGENWGTVSNCYSTGSVNGASWGVGGLVGNNYGPVTQCYSTGAVTGGSMVGGLVGGNSGATASFWDIQTSGQATSAGGTGKTTAEMQMAKTFLEAGWDFAGETTNGTEDIWRIDEGKDYPRLRWEATAAPAAPAGDVPWIRAFYYDSRYGQVWQGDSTATRNALAAAGYAALNADELKTWMDARIADKKLSVVVFCQDAVPDTVAETMSSTCTLRKYLDAGGKIVWYADTPLNCRSDSSAVPTMWGASGSIAVLGFNAGGATWDTYNQVAITPLGKTWGLTQPWPSRRPADPGVTPNLDVLATDNAGNAAAWVKHYVPDDTFRGFVRLYDTTGQANAQDLMRVAEYADPKASNPVPPASGKPLEFKEVFSYNLGEFLCENHLTIADFDRDGLRDIVLLVTAVPRQRSKAILLHNEGHWQFRESRIVEYPENHYGYWVQAADLNSDQWPDLVIRESSGTHVFLNQSGVLNRVWTGGPGYYSLDLADVNGDTFADILSGTQTGVGGMIEVFCNNGLGTSFQKTWQSGKYGSFSGTIHNVVAANLNGDSSPDIAAIEIYDGLLLTFVGDGTGVSFTQKTKLNLGDRTFSLAAGNVNGDKLTDLAVHVGWGRARVFLSQGNGSLVEHWVSPALGNAAFNLALADFDRDGYDDLFVGTFNDGALRIYGNRPGAGFGLEPVWRHDLAGKGYTGTVADVDGDGQLDLVVGEENTIRILHNRSVGVMLANPENPTWSGT